MQKKKEASSEKLYGITGTAFNFTAGDLQANRAGFMTQRQKMAQETIILRELLGEIFIFLLTLIFPFILSFAFVAALFAAAQNLSMLPVAIVMALVVIPLDLLWLWALQGIISSYTRLDRDIKESLVEKIFGSISVQSNRNNEFSLQIDKRDFPIDRSQAELLASLKDNIICVVYAMPHSKRILAIEEAPPDLKTNITEASLVEEEGISDAKEKRNIQ